MRIQDILTEDQIKVPLQNTEKRKIIEELVDVLVSTGQIKDKRTVLKSVLDREKVMSTGVGDGVAIPHGKSEGVDRIVAAFGVTSHDVDFEALDEKPVHLIFLLVGSPKATGPHLKALSRISRLLHKESFRLRLRGAGSASEVLSILREEESRHFDQ